jgi:hypothetical protein
MYEPEQPGSAKFDSGDASTLALPAVESSAPESTKNRPGPQSLTITDAAARSVSAASVKAATEHEK